MDTKKAGFINSENEVIKMEYTEILNYCKSLCEEEQNKQSYDEYKKGYTYFPAYFDFVVFELNYIFINPLMEPETCLIPENNSLYLSAYQGDDYQKNMDFFNTNLIYENISFMGKVSDKELGIKKQTPESIIDCLMDPNMMGLITRDEKVGDSHGITGNTVLNQLLMKSTKIYDNYQQYSIEDDTDIDNKAINYLVKSLGFLRLTSPKTYPMIIGNEYVLTEEEKELISTCQENGYHYFSIDVDTSPLTSEYERGQKEWNRKQM